MYLLSKYLRENTTYKVFLSGEGADEIFCGYNYFKQARTSNEIENETSRLIKNLHVFDVLRADRCFNSHGLEIRVPFLDKDFLKFTMGLDGLSRSFINNTEKFLLRQSFRYKYPTLISTRIIDRQKERMSDGCGFSYVPQLLHYCSENSVTQNLDLVSKENLERIF